ncbi:transmembrane protein 41B-like [Dendronephthya gigantea]|uniref:transmembrane protein 41B-like n=1 Tax=Dendronephthya gigantea TaxID=151771 RepID=UPI0010692BFF|nr:transmembrane protein 41B-like [Dendronephthya gigantea]
MSTRTTPQIKSRRPLPQKYPEWKYFFQDTSSENHRGSFFLLAIIFISSLLLMVFLYTRFPKLKQEDAAKMKLPMNMEDAKGLATVLSNYKDDYFFTVVLAFFYTYIFLQSFAIPGSIFLSILSGFLFPFPLALFLVCLCSSLGASFCYLLSYLVGTRIIKYYFPERIIEWQANVQKHKDDLLSYIIFLRITPFLPNWFINISSPVIDVPLLPFFVGTFVGVAPPSFGYITAGVEVHKLTTTGDVMTFQSIAIVIVSALLSLAPVLFRRQLRKKLE